MKNVRFSPRFVHDQETEKQAIVVKAARNTDRRQTLPDSSFFRDSQDEETVHQPRCACPEGEAETQAYARQAAEARLPPG
jgi:hypothetical protein